MGRSIEVFEKKSVLVLDTEKRKGYYCTLLCNSSLPAPLYCLQYCAIYFPHDPLYCNKILAISCKGQSRKPSRIIHDACSLPLASPLSHR